MMKIHRNRKKTHSRISDLKKRKLRKGEVITEGNNLRERSCDDEKIHEGAWGHWANFLSRKGREDCPRKEYNLSTLLERGGDPHVKPRGRKDDTSTN